MKTQPDRSDSELLQSMLAGEEEALVALYRRRQRGIYLFALQMCGSDNEAVPDQTISSSDGPLDELSRTETIESVRKAVLALPERYREVVVLCDLQEMSYAETAEVLGCAVGTVRSRLHRARRLLIEKLQPAREENANEAAMKSARCFA